MGNFIPKVKRTIEVCCIKKISNLPFFLKAATSAENFLLAKLVFY
jgi:hypothetical protein